MSRMPVLFIGHGSPMNIILDNDYTRSLSKLGRELPIPKAVLVVSAHWLTRGTWFNCTEKPSTIYDFYGFPRELYEIKYPCPGAASYINGLSTVVKEMNSGYDQERGLDHAAWAVLKHMYPQANIPAMAMSLDYSKPAEYHYYLGKILAPLRDEGVLIIGSGNIVHNLRQIEMETDTEPYSWAMEFDEAVKECLVSRRHHELIHYERSIKGAALAVPTNDHYLPMLYALALQEDGEPLKFTHEGIQNASISMRCFTIG